MENTTKSKNQNCGKTHNLKRLLLRGKGELGGELVYYRVEGFVGGVGVCVLRKDSPIDYRRNYLKRWPFNQCGRNAEKEGKTNKKAET